MLNAVQFHLGCEQDDYGRVLRFVVKMNVERQA